MSKSYAVLGLGSFGMSVARTFSQFGMEVLAVDNNKDLVATVAPDVTYAVEANVASEEELRSLGIEKMDGVIVAIGENMEANIMATLYAKELGVPFVVAKAESEVHAKILEKIGADRVVFPEKEIGDRLARNIVRNFIDTVDLSDRVSLVELEARENWIGKSIRELDFRNRYKLSIVAIRRSDVLDSFPDPDDVLRDGDVIIGIGKKDSVMKL